jgi:ATP-dependent RNA helicase DeaD
MNKLKFEELNLSKDLLKAITDLGFKDATPIQAQAIPEIIAGHDIIGQASTGTGKTAAFALPAIEKIDPSNRAVQILVLCPTRELAMQVATETNKFLKYKKNIFATPIYGGQPIEKQFYALRKGPQIIIGTPGRTMDHLERGTLRLGQVKMVVLDEADEMLNMGFRQDIEQILEVILQDIQTVLFSATMPPEILQLTKRYQKNPKLIKVAPEKLTIPAIEQIYFDVEQSKKIYGLMQLIDAYKPKLSIVFCNTKRKVDQVSKILQERGYQAAGIHGGIRQPKRDSIMAKFRGNRLNILVATDVAARGIDVPNVEIVFNYELPKEFESYVHRTGRTGRAGKTGKALSLVSGREVSQIYTIKRRTNTNITQQQIPSSNKTKPAAAAPIIKKEAPLKIDFSKNLHSNEELEQRASKIFGQIRHCMNPDELSKYLQLMEKFTDKKQTSTEVAAALLKMVMEVKNQKIQQGKLH